MKSGRIRPLGISQESSDLPPSAEALPENLFDGYDRKTLSEEEKERLTFPQKKFYESYWANQGRPPPERLVQKNQSVWAYGRRNLLLNGETAYKMDGRWLIYTDRLGQFTNGRRFIGVAPSPMLPFQRSISKEVAEDIMLWAKAEGWKSVKLYGTRRDKEQLWLAAKKAGLPIKDNFQPSKKTVEKWKAMAPQVVERKLTDHMMEMKFVGRGEVSYTNRMKMQNIQAGIEMLKHEMTPEGQKERQRRGDKPYTFDTFQQISDALDRRDYATAFFFGLNEEITERVMHGANAAGSSAPGQDMARQNYVREIQTKLSAQISIVESQLASGNLSNDTAGQLQTEVLPSLEKLRNNLNAPEAFSDQQLQQIDQQLQQVNEALENDDLKALVNIAKKTDPASLSSPEEPMAIEAQKAELRAFFSSPEMQERFDRNVAPFPMTLNQYEGAKELIRSNSEGAMALIEKGTASASPAPSVPASSSVPAPRRNPNPS